MEEDLSYTSICSAATLQSDKKGFFQSYADSVVEQAGSQWLLQFQQLTTDSDRLLKCYNDSEDDIHCVLRNVTPLYRSKAANISHLRRIEGERAAQKGKLEHALMLLNQSVIRAPAPGVDIHVDEGFSLACALWARAQVLWELNEKQLCLSDLQLCLKEKIPENYRIKVYWMMSQCYQSLNENAKAKVCLQVILKLAETEDSAWKQKTEAELKKLPTVDKTKTSVISQEEAIVMDSKHTTLPGMSAALTVRSAETTGRYVVAREQISTGEVLVFEPPYTACLLVTKFGSHCHHCFTRLRAAVPCLQCAGLAFCSSKCRELAQVYHKHECHYIDLMIGSGMSVLCYMALRTITQQKYSYWQKVYNKQPVSPDYNRILNLVTHSNRRQPKDFVSRTLMALFLLRILEHSHYIPPDCNEESLSGMKLFLGCVLLHQLQCLQFNAHEIYETLYKAEFDFNTSKINYVGVGVYPTVALFNHDCYPTVIRYFSGKDIVIRAARPLNPGDPVGENYGPVFTMRTKAERQRSLTSRYWFSCNCLACLEDWPKLTELSENTVNLRCTTKNCEGFVSTTKESKNSKEKCPKCTRSLNTKEALLLVKSYDDDYIHGFSLMSDGQLQDAVKAFSKYSNVMHTVCRPPNKNVSLAQEALRSCLAYNHNKFIIKQTK